MSENLVLLVCPDQILRTVREKSLIPYRLNIAVLIIY